jgi:hypothetical protein
MEEGEEEEEEEEEERIRTTADVLEARGSVFARVRAFQYRPGRRGLAPYRAAAYPWVGGVLCRDTGLARASVHSRALASVHERRLDHPRRPIRGRKAEHPYRLPQYQSLLQQVP